MCIPPLFSINPSVQMKNNNFQLTCQQHHSLCHSPSSLHQENIRNKGKRNGQAVLYWRSLQAAHGKSHNLRSAENWPMQPTPEQPQKPSHTTSPRNPRGVQVRQNMNWAVVLRTTLPHDAGLSVWGGKNTFTFVHEEPAPLGGSQVEQKHYTHFQNTALPLLWDSVET